MSQSFNTDAFKETFQVIFHDKSAAIPHYQVATIAEISPEGLWKQGIRGVIFDKDNTLTAPYINKIHPDLISTVSRFQHVFGNSMKILSNSAGTDDDKNYADAELIEKDLGIEVIRHSRKKPLGTECVSQQFSCTPEKILMVGDRLLTDILFGNRAGLLTVHTGVLTTAGDNKMAMIARKWENHMLKRWVKQGISAPDHLLYGLSLMS